MQIKNGDIIVVDDKEYVVYSKIEKNEKIYLYLLSNFKPIEIKFGIIEKEAKDSLEIIWAKDQQEKIKLLKLFQKEYNQNK